MPGLEKNSQVQVELYDDHWGNIPYKRALRRVVVVAIIVFEMYTRSVELTEGARLGFTPFPARLIVDGVWIRSACFC